MLDTFDIAIVGGGMAGASLAFRLAGKARVVLLEAEEHLGMHTSGRSAALLVEAYGTPVVSQLVKRSRPFLVEPPEGFAEAPLASPRGAMLFSFAGQEAEIAAEFESASQLAHVRLLDAEGVLAVCPILKRGVATSGCYEPGALSLDTNAMLQGYARGARRLGGEIVRNARVEKLDRRDAVWRIAAGGASLAARVVVNASGAWADHLAGLAGLPRLGLQPMRRTAATIPAPAEMQERLAAVPLVGPIDNSFYFKPDAGTIMVSLSEETPFEPCDVWADDIDVATALERFHAATIVPRARPIATWAGLRTFAPDRNPVVGPDANEPSFFWLAGQGGYGIKTSPALSSLAAKLLLAEPLDADEEAILPHVAPARFAAKAAAAPQSAALAGFN
jgi:D-arginine dehydrogenase